MAFCSECSILVGGFHANFASPDVFGGSVLGRVGGAESSVTGLEALASTACNNRYAFLKILLTSLPCQIPLLGKQMLRSILRTISHFMQTHKALLFRLLHQLCDQLHP